MWITLARQPRWTGKALHPEERITRQQAIGMPAPLIAQSGRGHDQQAHLPVRTMIASGIAHRNCPYRSSPSSIHSGRLSTSRGLLPSGGPMMPSFCIMSRMRAARP